MKSSLYNDIRLRVPISYEEFISQALYHPEYGYYQRDETKLGKQGDFYTSVHIHPVFAEVFSDYFTSMAARLNLPLSICEIGAGEGSFASHLVHSLQTNIPDASWDIHVIEQSPFHRTLLESSLSAHTRIYDSILSFQKQNPGFRGFIFSNEWLDAQPVRVVEKVDGILYEIYVSSENENLIETKQPCSEAATSWLKEHDIHMENNQRREIPVYMETCARQLRDSVEEGIIVTIDYGYSEEEWSSPARREGSLRGYKHHTLYKDVLKDPGSMDITHHIPWEIWQAIGAAQGLRIEGLLDQSSFLIENGILDKLQAHADTDPFSKSQKRNRAIRSLAYSGHLRGAFQVCIQSRGMEARHGIQMLRI
ncbi:SAM-dependent methyltransferase [Thalassobacillus sp. CUG 92003]|uniref:SAM-dependent methyltransferase n=1 Tax=Thalassobacillus sp. CUG 92003 TaxID=2736641 RepID=UPI0015E7AA0E|nr:SAM-dependent methyltransferase [Thalassobacillus sp. CUG 92003]